MGGLGSHIPRRETGPAGREHEPCRARQLPDRGRDLVALVGHDAPLDLVALPPEQLVERIAAAILPGSGRDPVRHRQHRRLQTIRSFVFSTRTTSAIRISLSTAFAMS